MNKRTGLDWWSHRAWIKFGCIITAVMTNLILINWENWSSELKVVASIAALIPVHVIEEWVFPGGFHYQYNFVMKSDYLDCYPMNRVSDMLTNLMGTFLYIALTIVCIVNGNVSNGIILGTMIFCALEFFMHTMFGSVMYAKFRDVGKTTIYGPGSITAYWGFTVLGVILLYCLDGKTISHADWMVALGILLFIGFGCILIPENLLKKKDSPYKYDNNGYFERFIK